MYPFLFSPPPKRALLGTVPSSPVRHSPSRLPAQRPMALKSLERRDTCASPLHFALSSHALVFGSPLPPARRRPCAGPQRCFVPRGAQGIRAGAKLALLPGAFPPSCAPSCRQPFRRARATVSCIRPACSPPQICVVATVAVARWLIYPRRVRRLNRGTAASRRTCFRVFCISGAGGTRLRLSPTARAGARHAPNGPLLL